MSSQLFARLEQVGAARPDKTAIVEFGGRTVAYGALVARATAFSASLTQAGIQPGESIAVLLPNSIAFVASAFAIWKSGAILAPLHVRYEEGEILKYVTDCRARAVVVESRLAPVIAFLQGNHAGVEHVWFYSSATDEFEYRHISPQEGAPPQHVPPPPARGPAQAALTQYSTGSTGMSKRVTRTHDQLVGEFDTVSTLLGITAADRILGAAPFFHSYGISNVVISSMLSGATLYAVNGFFQKDVARLIESEKITGFPGVPFMYQLLAELRTKSDFSSLRYALSAGAPLPAATAGAFKAAYGISIRQLYGSTETGVMTVEPPADGDSSTLSVGHPIPGVTVRIVDEAGHTVTDGGEGQVAVSSPFAARSYDNQQTRSESFFKDGSFFPGDLGQLGSDGRLTLIGRKRGFLNVAGNKVDPTEVEAVLREMPAIAEVVVVGIPDGAASEKVKAVLVASAPCTRNDVLEHCRTRLAEFKRPRVIEFRKEIPRSPLGKILRKYLIEEGDAPKYSFDVHTGFGKPPEKGSAAPDLATLPPFLRVLLVTDGTVTKNLEAYLWEPIDVDILQHEPATTAQPYPGLEVNPGDPIVKRRILLRGRITRSAYAFAETVIATDALPADMTRALVEGRKGIGEAIRERKLETYRELVSVERGVATDWSSCLGVESNAEVMIRTYIIHLGRRPAVQIVEVFPIIRFQSPP